ncbi:PD40 domain-containing protein [bacterium]|nr:PD40 domain-containing protein [bacterium]
MLYRNLIATVLLLCCAQAVPAAAADFDIDAAMLRFPDVSDTQIAFAYNNDLWIAPKGGGTAVPLSSPAGTEILPHFSPDGKSIAFTANYEGNQDVYIMPVEGGIPKRLTFGPMQDMVVGFDSEGNVLFSNASEMKNYGGGKIYSISPNGGIPEALPLEYGAFCSVEGDTIAFTPSTRENRTWKRYQGGLAQDIWLLNKKTLASERITDFPGTDAQPMLHGDKVYFVSDAGPENRLNLWVYDRTTKKRSQLTEFKDFDCKFPGMGPSEIVLENGGDLYLYGIASGELKSVKIRIPGDRPTLMTQSEDVSPLIFSASPSPNGVRLALEARGEIWTVPVEDGIKRNLTMSPDSNERYPVWSPDGKWIAYFSDADGDYELYVTQSDGRGETRQLTTDDETWFTNPVWSPDSSKIAFADRTGSIFIHSIEQETTFLIDEDPWAAYPYTNVVWSADSSWLAYSRMDNENGNGVIVLYDVVNAWAHQVTSSMFSSTNPTFDRNGNYLYFLTNRSFQHSFGDLDETYVFPDSTLMACVPLRNDVKDPWAGGNDDEEIKAEEKADESKDEAKAEGEGDEAADGDKPADEEKPAAEEEKPGLKIDIEGFEGRAILMPLPGGNYWNLEAGEGKVFYVDGNNPAGPTIMMFGAGEDQPAPVIGGAFGFGLLPDGKRMLVSVGGRMGIINAAPNQKLDKPVDTSGLVMEYEPRGHWRSLVRDAHRMYKYLFYDPNLHKVDWDKVGKRYIGMVDDAVNRQDITWIISEMISELNVGHSYYGGPSDPAPSRSVGLLGADYEYVNDGNGQSGIRIAHIFGGADWDLDARSPLWLPGEDVAEGDFIIAVNNVPVDPGMPLDAAMQGLAGQTTVLTISDDATVGDDDREVVVTPIGWDYELRRRDWIEANRRYVEEKTGGKVGYIYVPDTAQDGVNNLMRQFVGQFTRQGLIVDERWNGGGYIPTYFIDILSRKSRSYWARRDGNTWATPTLAHNGPKVMLANSHSGSGGDCFPYYWRQEGLGPIIGTRTWGGLIGISGQPNLVDGTRPTIPIFAFFELDGTWGIEGYGVDPDIEVIDDPGLLAKGQDPQLDRAIAEIMKAVEEHPYSIPPVPAYPDRSGKGTRPQDR